MCWSFEASIITWVIAMVTSLYLFRRGNKNDFSLALLILVYSSMQLWEALMWLDQKCGSVNKFATKAAYYALWSHILAAGIGLYIEYNNPILLVIGIAALVYAIFTQPKFGCSLKAPNGHLVWGFDPMFYLAVFSIILIAFWALVRPVKITLIVTALFVLSFLISYILNSGPFETTGSFWCWVCAFFCFLAIFVNSRP